MSELKPCPFCGSTDVAANSYSIEASVRCFGCFAVIVRKHPKYSDGGLVAAITAWNTRADLSDALLREAVEALDDARQSLVDSSEEIAELRLTLSKTDLELPWLSDAIDKQTIALAKLRAHLEGEKE